MTAARATTAQRLADLSPAAVERLRDLGIDPVLVAALDDLVEAPDAAGEFDVICRRAGWPMSHRWRPGGAPQPLPGDGAASVFWPIAKSGRTAIVVVGAASALWIASLLFGVGHDGRLHRRPNLPPILADAVPAALPETAPGLAQWIHRARGPEELFGELISDDLEAVALAIPKPKPPHPAADAIDAFTDKLLAICANCSVLPSLALLPGGATWGGVFGHFRGAGRTYALAGALELARQRAVGALNPPTPEGGDRP